MSAQNLASSAETILAKVVPGFGSYLAKQKRRDDDLAARKYLCDRLQECKRDLQTFLSPFVDAMNFAVITRGEKLRIAIETTQSKMRSAVEGYSSWFESDQVDEKKLKLVVDLDNQLVAEVDRLQSAIKSLDADKPDFEPAQEIVTRLKERFASRRDLLGKS